MSFLLLVLVLVLPACGRIAHVGRPRLCTSLGLVQYTYDGVWCVWCLGTRSRARGAARCGARVLMIRIPYVTTCDD